MPRTTRNSTARLNSTNNSLPVQPYQPPQQPVLQISPDQLRQMISEILSSQQNQTINIVPVIQPFKGSDDKIKVTNWLKKFELIAVQRNWSDETKIIEVSNYIVDDAQNWYIESGSHASWSSFKERMISRFDTHTVRPIIQFNHLRYDINKGMKAYFEEKKSLGYQSKLSVEQMVPIFIDGLHPTMAKDFVGHYPKTLEEFYNIACQSETSMKKEFAFKEKRKNKNNFFQNKRFKGPYKFNKSNNFHFNKNNNTNFKKSNNGNKNTKPPPSPCYICEKLSQPSNHWNSQCPNKGKPRAVVNNIEDQSTSSLQNPLN